MIPKDVKQLIALGADVFVEESAGEGIGFTDLEYRNAGATIQSFADLYCDKDLIIKFKGPSIECIPLMKKGCALFCMAHFNSYPDRAALLQKHFINVVAMEEVLESPKVISNDIILSKVAMNSLLLSVKISMENLDICILGYSDRLVGAIRRAGNRRVNSLTLLSDDITTDELDYLGSRSIYFYDSTDFTDPHNILSYLKNQKCILFDLKEFEKDQGPEAIKKYQNNHPPFEFGKRRIECLHETGQAGAAYGLHLLQKESEKIASSDWARVSILGYGNVGMGAIEECYDNNIRKINILGYRNTTPERINSYLEQSHLIINAAEQPKELRGKNFLISRKQVKDVIESGSVVIDLIGGSESNRSAVENVVQCTFMSDPFFIEDDVYFSALWGWPMMGKMEETAKKYSAQTLSVLIGKEKFINGLDSMTPGIQHALVCGPFK